MSAQSLTIPTQSPEETCRLAGALAPQLTRGDVILLSGDVGAGKTHFARCAILAALDVPEDVPSPTYTLVQTYAGPQGEIWHADLYRLSDAAEVEELGLYQAFTDAICLVEWPDRLAGLAPGSALCVTLSPGTQDESRRIDFGWTAERWTDIVKGLAHV